jgi:DNA polymerase-3 subunit beta
MKITIMRNQLVAALCTAGVADTRTYLNGIYLEATSLETRLTSTDGCVASMQRADAKGDNEVDGVIRFIIPRHAVEGVKLHKNLPTVEINDDGGSWGLVDSQTRVSFTPSDAAFPNCRRVLPANLSGEAAQFEPALVGKFAKAAKALGAMYKTLAQVAISHNGFPRAGVSRKTAALVTLGGRQDYVGLIGPLSDGDVPTTPPLWALSQLEPVNEQQEASADDLV